MHTPCQIDNRSAAPGTGSISLFRRISLWVRRLGPACGLGLLFLLALILSLNWDQLTIQAQPDRLYVAPTGSDTTLCTLHAPCRSIQRAVSLIPPGGEIRVAAGTYTATVEIQKNLALRGGYTTTDGFTSADPALNRTIIDAQGQADTRVIWIYGSATVSISGFDLTGGNIGTGAAVLNQNGTLTLEHCRIYGNTETGNEGGSIASGITGDPATSILRYNEIYGNSSGDGTGYGAGGGVSLVEGSALLESNRIHHNTSEAWGGGIMVWYADVVLRSNMLYANNAGWGGAIYLSDGALASINDTIYDNTAIQRGGGVYANNGLIVLANDLIISNTATSGGGIDQTFSTPNISYTDFWANTPNDGFSGGTGNRYNQDPQFVDASSYDLHIASTSPARDSGTSTPATIDFEGQPRPYGSGWDRGADEHLPLADCYARVQDSTVYTSVQAAIDAAPAGDVVQVAGRCAPTTGAAIASINKSLTLRGGYTVTDWSRAIYGPSVFDAQSARRGLFISGSGIQVQVENLWIENGAATEGAGVYVAGGAGAALHNLILVDNTTSGSGGVIHITGSSAQIVHNTLYANSASSGGGIYAAAGSTVSINSTNVSGNSGFGIYAAAGAGYSSGYNNVFGNSGGNYGGSATAGATNLSADPGFVNPGARDLRLDYGASSLINAADPGSSLTQDAQGYERPLGSRADIGAFESRWYSGVALSPSPNAPVIVNDAGPLKGTMLSFTHTVTNVGVNPDPSDTIALQVSNGSGWDVAIVGTPLSFVLAQGQSLTFYVHVTVPVGAPDTFYNSTRVTATVTAHPSSYAVVEDEIATPRIDLSPSYTRNADPGEIVTYTHTLVNAGPVSDTIEIDFNTSLGWSTRISPTDFSTITLQSGESVQLIVQVNVPPSAPANLEDVTVLRAISTRFPGIEAQVTDRTIANPTTGDRYVAPAGSNTNNNCTQMASPCAGVAYAVQQAVWGDTVRVAQGTYYERDIRLSSNVSLRGGYNAGDYSRADNIDPALTVIDAQNAGRALQIYPPTGVQIIVEGFTLRNGASSGNGGGVHIQISSPMTLSHIVIENCSAANGGGLYVASGPPILDHVTISNTTASGQGGGLYLNSGQINCSACAVGDSRATSGGGIYIASGATLNAWNSLVYYNSANAGSGGGVYNRGILNLTNVTLVGNAATNTAAVYGGGVYAISGSRTTITNTIVASNTVTSPAGSHGGGVYLLGATTLDYNDFWANVANASPDSNVPVGTHSISVDPLFVDSSARDFHLTTDSLCVDTADPNTVLVEDFEGDLRPSNQGYDIGADELSGCLARVMTPSQDAQIGPVYGVLQEAIDQAPNNYVIQVSGTCRGVQARSGIYQTAIITKPLTIRGGFSSDFQTLDPLIYTTTLDAQGLGRAVAVIDLPTGSPSVTLVNLWLTGGNATGLGGGPGGADAGGGVYVSGASSLLAFQSVAVFDCYAEYGGGIYVHSGKLDLNADTSLPVTYLTGIVGNIADWGGGIYNSPAGQVQATRSALLSNLALQDGGGLYNAGTLYIINSLLVSNTAVGNGGGLYNTVVSMTVRHDTFFGNAATLGGGIYQADIAAPPASPQPLINSTLIVSNTAASGGAGLYNAFAGLAFDYNDLFGNNASGAPAGVGNISVDPQFISTDPHELSFLRIPAGSPVEDVADPASPVHEDLERDPRPSNQGFDIGADEVGGCYVRNQRTGLIYGSIQRAVDLSLPLDTLQIAGACRGVNTQIDGGQAVRQTVFVSTSLTLEGGYTNTNWTQPAPALYPAYLDALGLGRVVYITHSAQITISGLHLIGGQETNGGAIWLDSGVLTLTESFVHDNQADRGGAIYNAGGVLVIGPNSEVMSNTAQYGGALYAAAGQTTVDNNRLYGNTANDGGAIYSAGGALTVTNSIVRDNMAVNGAAIYNANGTSLRVWHNTIYSNTATNGGGLYTVDALLDVRNNLFVSNTATLLGHAIFSSVAYAPDYNNAYPSPNASGPDVTPGTHSLTVDPLFIDAAGGDFHLQEGSPVQNQGDPAMTLWHDFEDDLRPGHQGFDMGVDEIPGCRARIQREPEVIYGNPQWAINHSQPGDVIEITNDLECQGVHPLIVGGSTVWQTVHITHNLTLIGGYDDEFAGVVGQTIFNSLGQGRALLITGTNAVTVSNIIMQNGLVSGGGPAGVVNAGGALLHAGGTLTLTNVVLRDSQAAYGGAIYNRQGALISWNTIVYSNTASSDGGGLYEAGSGSRILHNAFYNNRSSGNGNGIYLTSNNNAVVMNTILFANFLIDDYAIYCPTPSGPTLDYNNYYLNTVNIGGAPLTGTHSLLDYPWLEDPDSGDFHLVALSTLIDAGADVGVPVDIDGDPRPINTAPDIGPDEFNACLARIAAQPEVIYGRIQQAIDDAVDGDTIQIAIGVCYESLLIDKNITLSGNWEKDFSEANHDPDADVPQSLIDAGGSGRAATVGGVSQVELNWLILGNGSATDGGGIRTQAANLDLIYVDVISNTATNGGGIYVADGHLFARELVVAQNVASNDGGGIYQAGDSRARYEYTNIGLYNGWGNQAGNRGGGLYNAPNAFVDLTGSSARYNTAAVGGGIYSDGEMEIRNVSISRNEASANGGAIYIASNSEILLQNATVYSNTAGTSGGGIYRNDGTTNDMLTHNTIVRNHAGSSGGGVYNMGSSLPISASIVAFNTVGAAGTGSGIYGQTTVNAFYTLRWANDYAGSVSDSNGIYADPVFRSITSMLLHYDSPAIDAVPFALSAVAVDASLDPRDGPSGSYSPMCGKDMGVDEFIVLPSLEISAPEPGAAVVAPAEPITYHLSIVNNSENWGNVNTSNIWHLGPGSGYTETVLITLTSTHPDWSRISGIVITSTDGTPVLPGANVVIAGDGRSASLNLHPAYRADISVTLNVPPGASGDLQDDTYITLRYSAGNCAEAVTMESNTAVVNTQVLNDYNFVIAPDNWGIALPGETITYTHIITNLGNVTGTYQLYPKNGFYAIGEIAEPISAQVTLEPGMSATLVLSVTVNPEAAGGLEDITNLIARLLTPDPDPDIEKAAANRTTILYTSGTRYVSVDGQDSLVDETELIGADVPDNNCTQPAVAACRTVQQALNQAAPGDLIKIAQGVYSEVFTFTHQSAEITQIAFITQSVDLRGGYLTSDWEQTPGDHVDHTTALDPQGTGRGIYVAAGANVTVDRLIVRNGAASSGAGIYNAGELTLQNAFLYDNQATNGGALYSSDTLTLINNTLFRNSATGAGSALYLAAGSADLINTIVATHTVGAAAIHTESGATLSADYTLFYNSNGAPPGSNVLTDDPLFRAPGDAPPDLHLSSSSPAIDAGATTPLDGDYDNDYRPLNAIYDIGADEFMPRLNLLFYPDRTTAAAPNSTVTFTHTLHNDSDVADEIMLAISSNLGWPTVTEPPVGTPIPLGIGEQRTVLVTVTVPNDTHGQTFTAWITATSGVNPLLQAAVRDQINIRSAAWQIVKTVEPLGPVAPGDTLTYTITITNVGDLDSPLTDPKSIVDVLPAHTHLVDPGTGTPVGMPPESIYWNIVNTPISVGESINVSFIVTVSAPLTDGTSIVNTEYAVDGSHSIATGAPVTVTVSAPAQLSISKAASHDPVQPGDVLTYTITVTNSASAIGPAVGILITDTLPEEVVLQSMGFVAPATGVTSQLGRDLTWSLDDALMPGESAQVTVTVRITSPLDVSVLTNRFGVTSASAPAGAAGALNTAVDTANVIAIGKTVEQPLVEPGATVTYTIVVTNSGTSIATVAIDDVLAPEMTPSVWSGGLVVPGRDWDGAPGVRTVSFTATAPVTGGIYYNLWLTATYDSMQTVVQDSAPLRVAEPLDGLTLVNDSPTAIGQSTTLTASLFSGFGITYTLDLGDGGPPVEGIISAGEPVTTTHIYAAVGVYTATITATDGVLTQVAQSTVIIQEPVDGLVAENDSPTELGSATALTATVTAGSDVVFEWDLGDGSTAAGPTPTHTYPAVGVYTAIVTASNSVSVLTATTTVTVVDAPISGLTLVSDSPTVLTQPTAFTATLGAGTNVTYTWDFGDATGTLVTDVPTVTHTYAAAGVYTAVVTASNSVNWLTATTTVVVQEAVADLTWISDSPTVSGDQTTFTATISAGSDVTYTVDLGDGSPPSTGIITAGLPLTLTYTYGAPGAYTAVITVENGVSQMTATLTILVQDPVAGLVAENDSPTELGSATALTATVTAGSDVVFEWDLGDGSTAVGATVTHTYGAVGVYTAIVTASNSVSLITATTTITVVDAPISGLTLISDSPTILGQTTAFTATLTTGTNVTYTWDWGDGTPPQITDVPTPTHTYGGVGVYTAVVTASNSVNWLTATTTVVVQEAVADLTWVSDSPTVSGDQTTFTATISAGSDVTYTVDLGDGSPPSTGIITAGLPLTLTYTYGAPGAYTAVITVENGVSQMTATLTVLVEDPVAGLVAENDSPTELGSATALTATVTAGSNVVFEWDLGDGSTASGPTVAHTYGAVGVYTAIVTASNSVSLITATTTITIVDAPISGLTLINDSPTILGQTTAFTATLTTGTNVTYTWDWGDGTGTLVTDVPTHTHVYGAAGVYTAIVTASNSVNWLAATTQVTITLPTVDLAAAYSVGEGEGAATITVTLSAPMSVDVTVNYATAPGTATAGVDYEETSGLLTFAPGQLEQSFTVTIYDDLLYEGNETVLLALSGPVNATLGNAAATLTIVDDDGLPTVSLSDTAYQVDETAGQAAITVTLSHPSVEVVTVDFVTADGTATSNPADSPDYDPVSTTLTFAPGETWQVVYIPIHDDALVEGDETVLISVSNPVNALMPRPSEAVLTIIDDEPPFSGYQVYLPLVLKNYTPVTNRDLIVEQITLISANPTVIEVRIRNIGASSVPYPFWIDLYVDPNPPPTAANDLWNPPRCLYGGAWYVTAEIPPGGEWTVSTTTLDPAYSIWPTRLPAGTHTFYAQVDAYGSPLGMVQEDDETNNILGPRYFLIP